MTGTYDDTSGRKSPLLSDISETLARFDWRQNLITVYFSAIFASFFFLESEWQRLLMYIGMVPAMLYLYREYATINLRGVVYYIALGLGCYFLVNYISILWSEPEGSEKLFQRLKMIVIFPMILLPFALKARNDRHFWMTCLSAFSIGAVVSAVLLLIFQMDIIFHNGRFFGWGRAENPVQCGLLYGLAFLTIVFCSHKMPLFKNCPPLTCYALSLLPLAMLVVSQSRGPFLAAISVFVGLLVLQTLFNKKICMRKFLLVCLATLIGSGAFLFYGNTVTFERGSTGRIEIWTRALELIEEKPLLGHGIATKFRYPFEHNNRVKLSGHPHSIYVSALVHTGVVGFSTLLLAIAGAIYAGIGRFLKDRDPSFLIFTGFGATMGLVDFGGYYTNLGTTWLVFWFPLAALIFRPADPSKKIEP